MEEWLIGPWMYFRPLYLSDFWSASWHESRRRGLIDDESSGVEREGRLDFNDSRGRSAFD